MDWSSIERDVALRTETRHLRQIDLDSSMRSGKVSQLIDGILSSRLLVEDRAAKENNVGNVNELDRNQPLMKSLLADMAELQKMLRHQAAKLEEYGSTYTRYDHDVSQLRRDQETLFERVNRVESGLQGKSADADVVDLYHDLQLRLKRVESNVEGLEENSRTYGVQFATKDAFAKLLDTIFEQLKVLSATVELSKEQSTHAAVLFDALASAFVLLNGEDSRHQLELVTSFSREINRDHLSRILTDALMRSVDGSIQAHLKPAMALMHSSLMELIDELRQKQDGAVSGMRSTFQQLARQVHEDRSAFLPAPPGQVDANLLAELKQMKEQMGALAADNKSLRESLQSQSTIVTQLVTTQETNQTMDAESLLKLKSKCEGLEHDLFALQQECTNLRGIASEAQAAAAEATAQLQEAEERVTVLNSEVHAQIEALEGKVQTKLAELTSTVAGKAASDAFEAVCEEVAQHTGSIKVLQQGGATKADVEALQGKVDVVSSDLNILQDDLGGLEKKLGVLQKAHNDDVSELRRQAQENGETVGKVVKRLDQHEATTSTKISSLSTELHHKIADGADGVARLTRRFDAFDADTQAKNVALREAQAKVQTHSEQLADLTRKMTILDSSCSSQFSSVVSQQKSLQEEVADFTAKVTRKLDLQEAELLSKFNIRNDRVDALLMQNQESISKLGDRIEFAEHRQSAAMEELSSELRGKVSGAVDLTAQLNRRLETYQSELTARLSSAQTEMHGLNKTTNDRINAAIKQTDTNMELLQTQVSTKHGELAHKVGTVGDSLAHLAQQQFELSSLQEKQQMDLNTLSSELASARTKLEEKIGAASATFQTNLTQHAKAHTSALAEEKYDLLQLTSRVSLLEQLIRYGQDLEDQTLSAGAGGAALLMGGTASASGSPKGMGPRPADPDLRAKYLELKTSVEQLSNEMAAQKAETSSRLDTFKVSLAALRTQYEEEVQEIKEAAEDQKRVVNRTEQSNRSLQAQIDVLQVEVQSLGEDMDKRHAAYTAAQFDRPTGPPSEPVLMSPTVSRSSSKEAAPAESPDRARVLPLVNSKSPQKQPAAPATATTASSAATKTQESERTVKFSPSRHLMKTQSASPVRNFLAKKLETEQQGASPEVAKSSVRGGIAASDARTEDPASDDDDAHSEGSDVFPASPRQQDTEAVMAFSPGSVSSPPPRPQLTINTGAVTAASAAAMAKAAPATPDSPWDEESDAGDATAAPAPAPAASASTAAASTSSQDDSSSIDSDVRMRRQGPTLSSQQSGAATAVKSPVKLSGSLGRGRSSGPGFGASRF